MAHMHRLTVPFKNPQSQVHLDVVSAMAVESLEPSEQDTLHEKPEKKAYDMRPSSLAYFLPNAVSAPILYEPSSPQTMPRSLPTQLLVRNRDQEGWDTPKNLTKGQTEK